HMADKDGCSSTGDTGHAMMLCQPIAVIAPAFYMLREVQRVPERLCGITAFYNRGQIEHRKTGHGLVFMVATTILDCEFKASSFGRIVKGNLNNSVLYPKNKVPSDCSYEYISRLLLDEIWHFSYARIVMNILPL